VFEIKKSTQFDLPEVNLEQRELVKVLDLWVSDTRQTEILASDSW